MLRGRESHRDGVGEQKGQAHVAAQEPGTGIDGQQDRTLVTRQAAHVGRHDEARGAHEACPDQAEPVCHVLPAAHQSSHGVNDGVDARGDQDCTLGCGNQWLKMPVAVLEAAAWLLHQQLRHGERPEGQKDVDETVHAVESDRARTDCQAAEDARQTRHQCHRNRQLQGALLRHRFHASCRFGRPGRARGGILVHELTDALGVSARSYQREVAMAWRTKPDNASIQLQ